MAGFHAYPCILALDCTDLVKFDGHLLHLALQFVGTRPAPILPQLAVRCYATEQWRLSSYSASDQMT